MSATMGSRLPSLSSAEVPPKAESIAMDIRFGLVHLQQDDITGEAVIDVVVVWCAAGEVKRGSHRHRSARYRREPWEWIPIARQLETGDLRAGEVRSERALKAGIATRGGAEGVDGDRGGDPGGLRGKIESRDIRERAADAVPGHYDGSPTDLVQGADDISPQPIAHGRVDLIQAGRQR